MKRTALFMIVFFSFVLSVLVPKICAVSVMVEDLPSAVSVNPFSVTVLVNGANSGLNYLRVDLFKDGTSNYFGETYNGSDWYTGSVGTSYFPIDILSSDATVSATVQAQIGAPSIMDYPGPGMYKLRIRRYTSSSNYSYSEPYDVTIDVPTPSPSPTLTPTTTNTPTQIPASTKTPSPTQSNPVVTPTKTLTPTKISTPTPIVIVSDEPNNFTEGTTGGVVLGDSQDAPLVEKYASPSSNTRLKPLIISSLIVAIGLALLSGVVAWNLRHSIMDT